MTVVIILAVIVLGVAVVTVAVRQMEAAKQAWERAGATLGLAVNRGSFFTRPRIEGTMGPLRVLVDTFTEGGSNNNQTFTRYRVGYPDLGLGLELKAQTAFSRITRLFGAQDVEVGDAEFDDTWVVKAADPAAVRAFLSSSRRLSLLRLFSLHRRTRVDDTEIVVATKGLERNKDNLVSTTRRIAAAGRRLLDEDGLVDRMSRALDERLGGELAATSQDISTIVQPHPDDVDGRLLEVETLAASGRKEEAARAARRLAEVLPGDPEVEGWRTYAEAPERPAPAPSPIEAEEADARLFETLFSSDRLSFETIALFDGQYRGRPVTWSGTVRDTRSYRTDLDFGEGPGVKAVVTVATIDHDLYGQTTIDAVIQLPPGGPELRRGDRVNVSGTLDRVDPLMRNVYLTAGEAVTVPG